MQTLRDTFLKESGFSPSRKRGFADEKQIFALLWCAVYSIALYFVLSALSRESAHVLMAVLAMANAILLLLRLANYALLQGGVDKASQLPFHLCGMNVLLTAIAISTADPHLLDAAFGLSPIPALCAMLFPEADAARYPRPDKFRSLEYYFSHTHLLVLPIYSAVFLGFTPSINHFPYCVVTLLAMSAIATCMNRAFKANYMYLAWGPAGTPLAMLEAKLGVSAYRIFLLALILGAWLVSHAIAYVF